MLSVLGVFLVKMINAIVSVDKLTARIHIHVFHQSHEREKADYERIQNSYVRAFFFVYVSISILHEMAYIVLCDKSW